MSGRWIVSSRGETRTQVRARALGFVEEVLPDVDEATQVNVAQKIVDALWPTLVAYRAQEQPHG